MMMPRVGRLRAGFGSVSLPEIHVDVGGNIPRAESDLPVGESDPLWSIANAWPMMRADLRRRRRADNSNEDPTLTYPPAQVLASDIASIMIPAYIDRFAQRFAAVGKPLKYALLIVGIDSDPQSWFISRSPHDGYIWPPDGAQTGQSILIRSSGPDKSLEFFGNATGQDAFFQKLRDALDAHTPPMPYPDMLLGNIESRGDGSSSAPCSMSATRA